MFVPLKHHVTIPATDIYIQSMIFYSLVHVRQTFLLKFREDTYLFNSRMLVSCVGVYILFLT